MQTTLKCKWRIEKGNTKQFLKRDWNKWSSKGFLKKTKQYLRSTLWFWKILAVKDIYKRLVLNDDE